MNNAIYLCVGPSGSGKTTITEELEQKYGMKSVSSYTTRQPRYEGETGHIFVDDMRFNALQNIVAYTKYNGYRYCATAEQLDEANLYTIDIDGIELLLEKYNTNRYINIIYFDATVNTRIQRMLDRGDSDIAIVDRLYNDEQYDWYDKLDKLVWRYYNLLEKNVELYKVDANKSKEEVLEQVLYYMGRRCQRGSLR